MNNNYTNPSLEEYEDYEEGIDFLGIIVKILKHWKQIAVIGFTFGAIGIAVALSTTKMYTVKTSLAPEIQRAGNSSLSNIASMLGVGGLQMANSADAINISFFPQICNSTPFITGLFDVEVHSFVSPEDAAEGKKSKTTTVFDHVAGRDKVLSKRAQKKLDKAIAEGYDPNKEYTIDPTRLTNLQRSVYKYLASNVTASVDNKTGFSSVSVTMDDPKIATELADTVLRRLQEYVITYRTEKAQKDFDYYSAMAEDAKEKMIQAQAAYAASVDYDRSVILQSVNSRKERLRNEANLAQQLYSQMEQQRELARAKIQEMKPVFAVVQPATMPKDPNTSRKKIVIIWGLIGGFLACAWYGIGLDICKFLFRSIKERWNEDEEESEETKEA